MADKLRSVNTKFWDDGFIVELNPSEKLLFLYLITNPLTNLLGIYEITIRRISFDTGLKTNIIEKSLERFGTVRKCYFINGYVILPNWIKNQRLNTNMKIAISKEFKLLPKWLQNNIIGNGSEALPNDSKGFEMVKEHLGKYEIEIESEKGKEIENKSSKEKKVFNKFRELYPGTKRGNETEFENFIKKHKDWKAILPVLKNSINRQIENKAKRKTSGKFVPEWKHLKTWINNRGWEEENEGTNEKSWLDD